jgi:hypothetical protein
MSKARSISKLTPATSGVVSIAGTAALKVPVGTTAERPSGEVGQMRYNSNTGLMEFYSTDWKPIGSVYDNLTTSTGYFHLPNGTNAQKPGEAGQPSLAYGMSRYNTTTGFAEIYTATGWVNITNPPPTISAVSPVSYNGESGTSFTITGQFFTSNATVKFVTNNNVEFTAATVTFNSSNELVATTPQDFTVSQEPLSIKVVQSTGTATLPSAVDCGGIPAWATAAGTIATVYDAGGSYNPITTVTASDPDNAATISYSVTSGTLPAGTTLNSATGAISGDPTDVVSQTTSNFTITATDNAGNTSSRAFSIIVNPFPDGSTSAKAASSAAEIYSLGITTSGVYWIKPTGYATAFQTYCLMNSFGGNHWMLMFLVRVPGTGSSFVYNGSYWSTLNPLNVSSANLNYITNTTTDVATNITTAFPFRYLACSFYGRDSNFNTYLTGSATDNASHLLADYVNYGLTMVRTGTTNDADSVFDYTNSTQGGTSGSGAAFQGSFANQWRYNQSKTGYNGIAYARLGQAISTENYQSNFYSNNAKGLGLRSQNTCGNSIEAGFGFTNARHSGGGCGDGPSATQNASSKVEIWVR